MPRQIDADPKLPPLMFELPSLRFIGIWIVGALIAGVAVLASGGRSWYPAVIILLLTMCVTVLAQDD